MQPTLHFDGPVWRLYLASLQVLHALWQTEIPNVSDVGNRGRLKSSPCFPTKSSPYISY